MARSLFCIALGILVAATIIIPAQSQDRSTVFGFLTVDRWRTVDMNVQVGYVMGVADALSMVSTHLGNEDKLRLLRAFGTCLAKKGRPARVERVHALTRDLIGTAPARFNISKESVSKSVVAGWVELAVVDTCP